MDTPDAIIVGAGISGLAAADALRKAGKDALVLEAAERPGGRIRTIAFKGDRAEAGGQGIHSNYAEMLRLVDEYGLGADLIGTPEKATYLDRKGQLRLPKAREEIALLAGPRGAAEMLAFQTKYFTLAKPHPQFEVSKDIPEYDNVTADEAFKNYSKAFRDWVLRPLTQAMANTTPEATNLYYVVNSLKIALTTDVFGLAGGNVRLAEAMAAKTRVRYGARVESVLATNGRVDGVQLADGQTLKASHVILASEAQASGRMLTDDFKFAKDYLSAFPHVALPLVYFFLDRPISGEAVRFFGHVYHDATFNMAVNHARKSPFLVPSGKAIISAWPTYPDTLALIGRSDDEIIQKALSEVEPFVPGMRDWIAHAEVVRHEWGTARYPVGAQKRILEFKAYAEGLKGVSFAGTDYEFIHMEGGVMSGQRAARRALAGL